MQRYKLTVAYDGTNYCGWQRQLDLLSVQQALEIGVQSILRRRCHRSLPPAAPMQVSMRQGRCAMLILTKEWRTDVVRDAVNQYLVNERIAILLRPKKVDEEFHARFSATSRHYVYKMLNRRAPPVFERGFVWHLKRQVDVAAMDNAAKLLLGTHDFTTFRDTECQAESPVRNLDRFDVTPRGRDGAVSPVGPRLPPPPSALHGGHAGTSGFWPLERGGSGQGAGSAKTARPAARLRHQKGLYLERVDY